MNEDESGKRIVPLSVKDLAHYEKASSPGPFECEPGPVVRPVTCYNNVKLSSCRQNHFGPKIVASHVTVHLPNDQKGDQIGRTCGRPFRWWLMACLVAAALVASLALAIVFTLPATSSSGKDDGDDIIDGGNIPDDWYYTRTDRNSTECSEPDPTVAREQIVVDSSNKTCHDPTACLELINTFDEGTDFYLSGGRVYEGYGWNCKPQKGLRIVFLTKGQATQLDMYAFNKLLSIGQLHREIEPYYEVFPACCVDLVSHGPSRGILLFLQTLVRFRIRECLSEKANCKDLSAL